MDIRTYPHDADSDVDAEQMTHFDAYAELNAYAAENARLTNELDLRIRQLMDVSRHCGQLLTANETLRNELSAMEAHWRNVESLSEQLRADLNNERNAHNATAAQLYAELAGAQDTATAAVQAWRTVTAERDALRAELDAQAKRHADVIERWKVEENTWCEFDKEQLTQIAALRAELDAMRQAHSVVAARMAAMGC